MLTIDLYPTPQVEEGAMGFELKSAFIHLLPKFHGSSSEDPNKRLREFHVVCSMVKPIGVAEDYAKVKAFPFSICDTTKDWLYLYLTPITT